MENIIGYVLPNGVEIIQVITKDGMIYIGIDNIMPLFEKSPTATGEAYNERQD